MLEDIHTTPEERRKTAVTVSLSTSALGTYLLADGLVTGSGAGLLLGAAATLAGAASLLWTLWRPGQMVKA